MSKSKKTLENLRRGLAGEENVGDEAGESPAEPNNEDSNPSENVDQSEAAAPQSGRDVNSDGSYTTREGVEKKRLHVHMPPGHIQELKVRALRAGYGNNVGGYLSDTLNLSPSSPND